MSRVILLPGKDKTPNDIWYPWIKNQLTKSSINCDVPALPEPSQPKLADWLAIIDSLNPDNDTILTGHSRGGMAILRWLEKPHRRVKKVAIVATNNPAIADGPLDDFYLSGPYKFDTIKSNCNEFVVFHSKDDRWVPYEAGIKNAEGLNAKLVTFENKNHFGSQADGSTMTEFPELLKELMA